MAKQTTKKKMIIVKGKGTPNEQRFVTDIDMYWCPQSGTWVTIPKG